MNPTDPEPHRIHAYGAGLDRVAASLHGAETIYSGFRPYDYHPGNRIVIAVYPHLLARRLAARKVTPRFRYVITLSDLEPSGFDFERLQPTGPSYHSSVAPEDTLQKVETDLRHLRREFPEITIEYYKTSDMVQTAHFQRALQNLRAPASEFLAPFVRPEFLSSMPLESAELFGLVCPACKAPVNVRQALSLDAAVCGQCSVAPSSRGPLSFWMYYVPLMAMKLRVIQPDLALLGGDYLEPLTEEEGAGVLRNQNKLDDILTFYRVFESGRSLQFLIPPLLNGSDGRKMSKSLGNRVEYSYEQVLAGCDATVGGRLTLS